MSDMERYCWIGGPLCCFMGVIAPLMGKNNEIIAAIFIPIGIIALVIAYLKRKERLDESYEGGVANKAFLGLVGAVILIFLVASCSGGGISSSHSRTCGSCGRSFSDSSNTSSIARNGMCSNCYNNYQWGKSVIGK